MSWRQAAACRDQPTDLFFPERGHSNRAAKVICGACPVRVECLEWALAEHVTFGIWGGLATRPRQVLARSRGLEEPVEQAG